MASPRIKNLRQQIQNLRQQAAAASAGGGGGGRYQSNAVCPKCFEYKLYVRRRWEEKRGLIKLAVYCRKDKDFDLYQDEFQILDGVATIKETRDRIAHDLGYNNWNDITDPDHVKDFIRRFLEYYENNIQPEVTGISIDPIRAEAKKLGDYLRFERGAILGRLPSFKQVAREKQRYDEKKADYWKKLEELKGKYRSGEIDRAEYKQQRGTLRDELRKERDEIYGRGGYRGFKFFARGAIKGEQLEKSAYSQYAQRIMWLFGLLVVGAVAAAFTGSLLLFFGFLSLGIYFVFPDPSQAAQPVQGPMGWGDIFNPRRGGAHAGFGWIRSIAKVTAIVSFALAFQSFGDTFNVVFIATVFFGYFWMAIEYDPRYPGQFIESLLRFGVLGAYFIPFVVFGAIFQSWVLVAVALAFFAIPPLPVSSQGNIADVLERGLAGTTMLYKTMDTALFVGLMILALIGAMSGWPGWDLTGALQYTFIYFWAVSLIGGVFSSATTRPYTGILMVGGATIIYGVGPGSQQVGSALFGQWWPVVHNGVTDIFEPVVDIFGQLGQTFNQAFLLVTNPVGYATSILNGTYAENPTGHRGALGVELTGLTISQLYIDTPYLITATIKNEGSQRAKAVDVILTTGQSAPLRDYGNFCTGTSGEFSPTRNLPRPGDVKAIWPWNQGGILPPTYIPPSNALQIADLGVLNPYAHEDELFQQDSRQFIFESSGIALNVSNAYCLRGKYIPVVARVEYVYETASELPIEFLSENEWERLAMAELLYPRQEKSSITTGPAKLNLGTKDQPIIEGTLFHLGVNLNTEKKNSLILNATIDLTIPNEFIRGEIPEFVGKKCTAVGNVKPQILPAPAGATSTVIRWVFEDFATYDPVANEHTVTDREQIAPVYCTFDGLPPDIITGPSKTYLIRANTTYHFTSWEQEDTRIEFGGLPEAATEPSHTVGLVRGIPEEYRPFIDSAAATHGVDPALIAAVIQAESSWNPSATHTDRTASGAIVTSYGLMQLLPTTAGLTPTELLNPEKNIMAGTKHLADLITKFDVGTPVVTFSGCESTTGPTPAAPFAKGTEYVIAAYNAGGCENLESQHAECAGQTRWQCRLNTGYATTRQTYVPTVLDYREQYAALP